MSSSQFCEIARILEEVSPPKLHPFRLNRALSVIRYSPSTLIHTRLARSHAAPDLLLAHSSAAASGDIPCRRGDGGLHPLQLRCLSAAGDSSWRCPGWES